MNKKEMTSRVENCIRHIQEIYLVLGKWEEWAGIENPISSATYRMIDNYVDSVSELVGDDNKWISWYIFDNQFGRGGLEATSGGVPHHVDSVKKLVQWIRNDI